MATVEETLLTAEEFGRRPGTDCVEEARERKGRHVAGSRHGKICAKISRLLGNFVEDHDAGHVLTNDSGVVTERNPDTVRGADAAFYSHARVPKGPLPKTYLSQAPELVFEVKSASDRWPDTGRKVAEYLNAGVLCVTVLDPDQQIAIVYSVEEAPRNLGRDDELTYPDALPGFTVVVGRLFE